MTQKSEGKGWGLTASPSSVPRVPGCRLSALRRIPAGGLVQDVFGVSRHLRFGWDT